MRFTPALLTLPTALAVLPPTLPSWEPTYSMSLSTITMQCNSSGWSDPTRGSEFGIVSYDWSNSKNQWAKAQPMDCEERLLEQASMTKNVNPNSHTWVYRNVVKALPWFTSVREILDDPDYSGFFLKFDPDVETTVDRCAAENQTKCSEFYHDQMQTPAVPTEENPNPDGSCDPSGCNSGENPTGEYLFDHRNGTQLLNWIIDNHILSNTAIGHEDVDGMFMDDFWCSDLVCEDTPTTPGCPCNDPVQGATEIDANQQKDMGLSDEEIRDLYYAWDSNMEAIQQAILDNGGYTWSLIKGQDNANASPDQLTQDNCAASLREACSSTSQWQTNAKLFGLTVEDNEPSQLEQDVAYFLLARGDFAWLGWGVWGMTWPFNPEPAHGELPPLPDGVPMPEMIDRDFGAPQGICEEVEDGVFRREWSSGTVELDCNSFEGSVPEGALFEDDLPETVDWSLKGAVSPIGDEAACGGACWAFAASSAVESARVIFQEGSDLIELSTQQLVNCVYPGYDSCERGGDMGQAFDYVKGNGGLCSRAEWDYDESATKQGNCDVNCAAVEGSNVKGFKMVEKTEEALMRAVARQPIAVAIQGLVPPFSEYKSGVLSGVECGSALDHGVLLVGYGVDENGVKFWKLKNDFGEEWGEDGYARIERGVGGAGGVGMCGILLDASYPVM